MTETLAGQAVAVFTENGTAELINLIGPILRRLRHPEWV